MVERNALVLRGLENLTDAVREGAAEGIREGTDLLVKDVAAHTPRKSGKASRSVEARFRESEGGQAQASTVSYDWNLWYMRIVILGAEGHFIPKLKRDEKRAARARKGHERKGTATGRKRRDFVAFTGGRGDRVFRKRVWHPGIGAAKILTRRLTAMEGQIYEAIRGAINKRLYLKELQQGGPS